MAWPLLFVFRLEAAVFVFRAVLFFAVRVDVFPFAEAGFPLPIVFFVTLGWVLFFAVCAMARPFSAIIVPISKNPTTAATEILTQLRNIVSLFFLPTYLLYAARPDNRAIVRLTESGQIRFAAIVKKSYTESSSRDRDGKN